jgi:hypothetical protein
VTTGAETGASPIRQLTTTSRRRTAWSKVREILQMSEFIIKPPFGAPLGGAYGPAWDALRVRQELRKGVSGYTTTSAMQAFLSGLEPRKGERETAAEQQADVRAELEKQLLGVISTFLSGSYRRHTQRRPVDDIDLLVLLDPVEYLTEASVLGLTVEVAKSILTQLEAALRNAFKTAKIVRFNRGVQIKFADSGITFDVVPAFRFAENVFYIPDTDLSSGTWGWLKTNPKEQERLVSEANAKCGEMLVPLVKLLKAAHAEAGKPGELSGFHLEAMAYHALQHAPQRYDEGLLFLFEQLSLRVYGTTPDIWPEGEPVGRNLTLMQQQAAAEFFRQAADRAGRAISADDDGRPDDAHAEWYALFGAEYPETGTKRGSPAVLTGRQALHAAGSGALISATSNGLISPTEGYSSRRSGTSHGELATVAQPVVSSPPVSDEIPRVLSDEARQKLDENIAEALNQFQRLRVLTPAEAAADPALWPVTPERARTLYAVLVGEQRTNQGTTYPILVTIPLETPAVEPRVFLLASGPRAHGIWAGGRYRGHPHRWMDGALCTHAERDRWDGRVVTLLIWAADYLVRYDHYQRTGFWIGREMDADGQFRMNGRHPSSIRRRRR